MKTNDRIEKMTEQEWAEAAAWLSGENSPGDEAARALISEDPELMKKWNDLGSASGSGDIDVDGAWEKLSSRIDREVPQVTAVRRSLAGTFMRIAAMIIIAVGLGWVVVRMAAGDRVVITSSADQKNIEVNLPDGSRVYLNRNSRLTYSESPGRNHRRVSLKGEAFFDITRDPSRPFIIDAGKAKVRVLGTSFNVITDNGNNEVEVYVSTGKVMLTSSDGSRSLTLEPGYVGKLSDEAAVHELNTNANYLSWNTGMLTYDGERLESVFAGLKKTYNIDITVADPSINDLRLTSMFDNQPQDTIIQVICTTFNLRSVREGNSYSLHLR